MISLKKIGLVVSSVLLLSGSAAQAFTVEEVSNLLAQSPGVSGEQFAAMKSHNLPSGDRVLVLYGSSCSDMTEAEAAALVPFVLYKKVATPSGDCVVVPANANVAAMNMTADTGSQTQQGIPLEQATVTVSTSTSSTASTAPDGSTQTGTTSQTTSGTVIAPEQPSGTTGISQSGSFFGPNTEATTIVDGSLTTTSTQTTVSVSVSTGSESVSSSDSSTTSISTATTISPDPSTTSTVEGAASIEGSTIPVIAVPEASTY